MTIFLITWSIDTTRARSISGRWRWGPKFLEFRGFCLALPGRPDVYSISYMEKII